MLLLLLFPLFLFSIACAEQMTHHHSRLSPVSLRLWDILARLSRLLCSTWGWGFILGVLRFRKGQNGPGPGSGFLPPFSLHHTPYWESSFFVFKFSQLVTLPPFSFVYVLYHHRYPNASHGFGEKKRISGGGTTAALLIPNPAQ